MTARTRMHRALGLVAVLLAALAAASGNASPGATSLHGSDVSALELARWIRDGRPNLRLLDLRDAEAFESFAIPGAERVSATELAFLSVDPDARVVVYGDREAPVRAAQEALRKRGVDSAYILRGGVGEWVSTIAAPMLPANPASEEAALAREIAEMSRWFGGVPRVGDPPVRSRDSVRAAMGRIRRRGC